LDETTGLWLINLLMGIKRISAYAAIYLFWGGSYLAIRYVVEVVPPFFAAGLRYTLAGLILIAFSVGIKRQPLPDRHQIFNAITSGIALLTISYGVVYWAETRLSSWIVAVIGSTIFLWTYLGECLVQFDRPRARMLLPLIAGLSGMPLLLKATFDQGQVKSLVAAIAVLLGSCLWAATILTIKRIKLPHSYIQTAALQMSSSGITLFCISWLSGEMSRLPSVQQMLSPRPLYGMAYLVIASSVLAFTAFHWLLVHESAALVASSAYVNPMVAMLLGIVAVHERSSHVQLLGAAIIVGSILLIWFMQNRPEPRLSNQMANVLEQVQ
jgi:drug/metabolite transporter (DMT)-like permease